MEQINNFKNRFLNLTYTKLIRVLCRLGSKTHFYNGIFFLLSKNLFSQNILPACRHMYNLYYCYFNQSYLFPSENRF